MILAVDPGMATGLAWWDGSFHCAESSPPMQAAEDVYHAVQRGNVDEIAMEDFRLGGGRAKTQQGTKETIELIGAIKWIAGYGGVPVFMQWPWDAADFSTNDKLKAAGFVTPSRPDHMRSAARHLLLHLVRNGTIDGASLIR